MLYPPLMRAPLKMRGVFGLSWQLYKRGFWQMFGLTLLLMFLFVLIMGILLSNPGAMSAMLEDLNLPIGEGPPPADSVGATSTFKFARIPWMIGLVYALLVTAAFLGAVFMEMDQRMEGRCSTFDELVHNALPIGFKRYYSMFLYLSVVRIPTYIVIRIVLRFMVFIVTPSSTILAIVLTMLAYSLLDVAYNALISLIYPVAVHEGKRVFGATGRAIKLSLKRLGRVIGALMLYELLLLAVLAIILLPLIVLAPRMSSTIIGIFIGLCLWTALIASYYPAFCTALYVDCAARMPDVPDENAAEPPSAPLPQSE